VALSAQKKKKAARPKSIKIEVFLLPKLLKRIPRGVKRKSLKEAKRCKMISVTRRMSALQVKNVILREYAEDFPLLNNFLELKCASNNFLKCSSHGVDGDALGDKKEEYCKSVPEKSSA